MNSPTGNGEERSDNDSIETSHSPFWGADSPSCEIGSLDNNRFAERVNSEFEGETFSLVFHLPQPTEVDSLPSVLSETSSQPDIPSRPVETHRPSRKKELPDLSKVSSKEASRVKRLIRNRESAALSRARKKAYVDNLESQLVQLAQANKNLLSENQQLRAEVSRYGRMLARVQSVPPSSRFSLGPASTITLILIFLVAFAFAPWSTRELTRATASVGGRVLASLSTQYSAPSQPHVDARLAGWSADSHELFLTVPVGLLNTEGMQPPEDPADDEMLLTCFRR